MHTELRETATELAEVLWREHIVYRERGGGVVIRGEHVQRWISLAPRGTRDEVIVRAGRILEGGTTAPARSETVVSLAAGTAELAAVCRRLLADAAAGADTPPRIPRQAGPDPESRTGRRPPRPGRTGGRRSRHTSWKSWLVLVCVLAVVGAYAYSVAAAYR
ncbi:hypothetical protein [Streptomyces sp. NPDC047928]|uniref:hypothetical protein n=1 Tax=unclassified Streptomyces TaxID=2593676 RepID=UPI003712231E